MTAESHESILPRFDGPQRSERIAVALLTQYLISGDAAIAQELASQTSLRELGRGETLIAQGAADSVVYFLLGGALNVLVNEREIAIRRPGQHVGEMSLLDVTARRSATVIAAEQSVVAAIPHDHFAAVANKHPELWRRVAVELACRLKERAKEHTAPRNQPVIFLASSAENLEVVREIQNAFSHDPFVLMSWTTGVFDASATPIESLVNAVKACDFGVVVVNPDDVTVSRL
jgi:CRP/FNR family cyclic AMP-dependent transcriptional regulator